jgi:hyperosmotically inducible protein
MGWVDTTLGRVSPRQLRYNGRDMKRSIRPAILVFALCATGCSSPPAGGPQPQVTQIEKAATDALLIAAVKARLIAVDPNSTTSLGVSANGGTVTLTGSVRSARARSRTLDAARATPGVKAVNDELKVDPSLPDVGGQVGDAAIAARIEAAIFTQTGAIDVKVAVARGVVTLSGTPSAKVRDVALATAHHTTGVRDVVDRMTAH